MVFQVSALWVYVSSEFSSFIFFFFFWVPVLFCGLLGFLGVFFFGPPTLSRVFSFAVVVIVVVFELLGCDNQSSIVCCGRGKENDRVWILKESREGGGEEFFKKKNQQ